MYAAALMLLSYLGKDRTQHGIAQIEARELQAEAERLEREMELEKVREAEKQKKLDEAAAKQRAREKEIEEREVDLDSSHCTALAALHAALVVPFPVIPSSVDTILC